MSLRSPLGKARGLGTGRTGTGHWWIQRLTAVALVPLTIWFLASLIGMLGADYASVQAAFRDPVTATVWALFVVAVFHHGQLGLQVVVEDYVHDRLARIAALVAVKLGAIALAALCLASIVIVIS